MKRKKIPACYAKGQRQRSKQWSHQYEVEYVTRKKSPGSPEVAVVYFATKICTVPKNWRGASIEFAADFTMQTHLRHEFTDSDQLLMAGTRRKEARRLVQPKINAMMASWKNIV